MRTLAAVSSLLLIGFLHGRYAYANGTIAKGQTAKAQAPHTTTQAISAQPAQSVYSKLLEKGHTDAENLRASVQKNICAPTEELKQRLVSDGRCYELADGGAGLSSLAASVATIAQPLDESARIEQVKREIAFLAYYQSRADTKFKVFSREKVKDHMEYIMEEVEN